MFNRGYGGLDMGGVANAVQGTFISLILALLAAIVLVILLYVLVLPKSKDGKLNGFFQWVHNYFHMKKLYIESVLRFFFILNTMFWLCFGFFMMFAGKPPIITGLMIMVVSFIVNRLLFEFNMMIILLVKNTMEINNKLNNKGGDLAFADQSGFTEKFSQAATAAASAAASAAANSAQSNNAPAGQAPAAQAPQGQAPAAEGSAVCPSCGKPVAPGTKFCMVCGAKIS